MTTRPETSPDHIIIIGPGQLGRLFAGAALRCGATVHPVTRTTTIDNVNAPSGAPVWVCVPEAVLDDVVATLPAARRAQVILVQNEIFPASLERLGLDAATVAVVWFAQKAGQPTLVARPTQAIGPLAAHVERLCDAIEIPAETVTGEAGVLAMIEKYAFILSINALGLLQDRTIGAWLDADSAAVDGVVQDALQLGRVLAGAPTTLNLDPAGVRTAMRSMASYRARGRSAPARVRAARRVAVEHGIETPSLVAAEKSIDGPVAGSSIG